MTRVRRAVAWVPLAPIVLISVTLGADALARDLAARASRFWAELADEIERNR